MSENIYQDRKVLIPTVKRVVAASLTPDRKGTRCSLSRLFKECRRDRRVCSYGDYLLMSYILVYVYAMLPEHKWTRRQMMQALKYCTFWEEEGRKRAYVPKEWRQYVKAAN